jgi:hypothetical protein
MRTKRNGERTAPCAGCTAWREEVLSCAFETYLGISRLIATVQSGPLNAPPTRKQRLPRQSR